MIKLIGTEHGIHTEIDGKYKGYNNSIQWKDLDGNDFTARIVDGQIVNIPAKPLLVTTSPEELVEKYPGDCVAACEEHPEFEKFLDHWNSEEK